MSVHVASEPVGLVQKCRMCGFILADNRGERAVAIDPSWTAEQRAAAMRPSFWKPGAYVQVEGNMSGVVDVEERVDDPCDGKVKV